MVVCLNLMLGCLTRNCNRHHFAAVFSANLFFSLALATIAQVGSRRLFRVKQAANLRQYLGFNTFVWVCSLAQLVAASVLQLDSAGSGD